MKKVSILGHFAFGQNAANGQTIKTEILSDALEDEYTEQSVMKIDTYGGVKTLFKAPFQVISALKKSKNVIMLPAHNGVRIYGRLFPLFKRFFKGRKIYYVVIGGWIADFIKDKKGLSKSLKRFDGIYVETNTMKKALIKQGFENVHIMPNFKSLKVLDESELVYSREEPYKLCTFSRVNEKKGIADAVNAVKEINEKKGRTLFTLDIFGSVDSGQEAWFEDLKTTFHPCVQYKGLVDFDKSVEVLKDYYALLFPTKYYTEGIPGTIIDAYAAGVPVISAKWESFADIVEDGITGVGYEFGDYESLIEKLDEISRNPESLNFLKAKCLKKSVEYLPRVAVKSLLDALD